MSNNVDNFTIQAVENAELTEEQNKLVTDVNDIINKPGFNLDKLTIQEFRTILQNMGNNIQITQQTTGQDGQSVSQTMSATDFFNNAANRATMGSSRDSLDYEGARTRIQAVKDMKEKGLIKKVEKGREVTQVSGEKIIIPNMTDQENDKMFPVEYISEWMVTHNLELSFIKENITTLGQYSVDLNRFVKGSSFTIDRLNKDNYTKMLQNTHKMVFSLFMMKKEKIDGKYVQGREEALNKLDGMRLELKKLEKSNELQENGTQNLLLLDNIRDAYDLYLHKRNHDGFATEEDASKTADTIRKEQTDKDRVKKR